MKSWACCSRPKHVLITGRPSLLTKAYGASPDLKIAMPNGGVISPPDVAFLEPLLNDHQKMEFVRADH